MCCLTLCDSFSMPCLHLALSGQILTLTQLRSYCVWHEAGHDPHYLIRSRTSKTDSKGLALKQ